MDRKFLSIIDRLIFQKWNSIINIILNDEFEFQTIALIDICVFSYYFCYLFD
jgi:hypothetical protein